MLLRLKMQPVALQELLHRRQSTLPEASDAQRRQVAKQFVCLQVHQGRVDDPVVDPGCCSVRQSDVIGTMPKRSGNAFNESQRLFGSERATTAVRTSD